MIIRKGSFDHSFSPHLEALGVTSVNKRQKSFVSIFKNNIQICAVEVHNKSQKPIFEFKRGYLINKF